MVPGLTALPDAPPRLRLLLIEPEPDVAAALARGLARHGWAVARAAGGADGQRLWSAWAPAVVLLAGELPDMDVPGLVARLAGEGACTVLVLSCQDDDRERQAVLARGAADYLLKPLRAGELAERIVAAVAAQRRRPQSPAARHQA